MQGDRSGAGYQRREEMPVLFFEMKGVGQVGRIPGRENRRFKAQQHERAECLRGTSSISAWLENVV